VPPTIEDRLLDILEAIRDVETILHGKTFEQFTEDRMLRFATERLLEIVCEASRKLPDSVKQDGPDINWQRMIDFGNQLRHAYHETDVVIVWNITAKQLPPLKAFAERRLRALGK
jgi:uncharacterized protein with HEPN domain